jgi:chromosome segregation ATPase
MSARQQRGGKQPRLAIPEERYEISSPTSAGTASEEAEPDTPPRSVSASTPVQAHRPGHTNKGQSTASSSGKKRWDMTGELSQLRTELWRTREELERMRTSSHVGKDSTMATSPARSPFRSPMRSPLRDFSEIESVLSIASSEDRHGEDPVEALKGEGEQFQVWTDHAVTISVKLVEEVKTLRWEKVSLQRELEAASRELFALKKRVKSAEPAQLSLQRELDARNRDLLVMQKRAESAESMLSVCNQELGTFRNRPEAVGSGPHAVFGADESLVKSLCETIRDLQAQNDFLRQQSMQIPTAQTDAAKQANSAPQSPSNHVNVVGTSDREKKYHKMARKVKELEKLIRKFESNSKRQAERSKQVTQLKGKLESKLTEVEAMHARASKSFRENMELKKRLEHSAADSSKLHSQRAELRKEMTLLQQQRQKLRAEVCDLSALRGEGSRESRPNTAARLGLFGPSEDHQEQIEQLRLELKLSR